MRQVTLILLTLFFSTYNVWPQASKRCDYGIIYEVSSNHSWGYGELVITEVLPDSPAQKAGLKVNDIIMEVNSKATYLRNHLQIYQMMHDTDSINMKVTIRNLNTYFREYPITRHCVADNSISEAELGELFAGYSKDDAYTLDFETPIVLYTNKDVDYSDYRTFGFAKSIVQNSTTKKIVETLISKGLLLDNKDPDFLITVETSQQLTSCIKDAQFKNEKYGLRFDISSGRMKQFPVSTIEKLNEDGYTPIRYEIAFWDRKYISTDTLTEIWKCNIQECLTPDFNKKSSTESYISDQIPLMLMQYPYEVSKITSKYEFSIHNYNYTGIYYDVDNMSLVKDVDYDSPAYKAGIRPGYRIRRINTYPTLSKKDEVMYAYNSFLDQSAIFRHPSNQLWEERYYNYVKEALGKPGVASGFSYLFSFRPWIRGEEDSTLIFEGTSANGSYFRAKVKPIIREHKLLKIIDK